MKLRKSQERRKLKRLGEKNSQKKHDKPPELPTFALTTTLLFSAPSEGPPGLGLSYIFNTLLFFQNTFITSWGILTPSQLHQYLHLYGVNCTTTIESRPVRGDSG